jgi:thiol-disulfide isomerase/thioredoxin
MFKAMKRIDMQNTKIVLGLALLVAVAAFPLRLVGLQDRPEQPPEFAQLRKAIKIEDPAARLAELERIQAAYPNSQIKLMLDSAIISTRVEISTDLAVVLDLQKKLLQEARGLERLAALADVGQEILEHPNLKQFDPKAAAAAVVDYSSQGLKLAEDPEFLKSVSEDEKPYIQMFVLYLTQAEAQAYLSVKDADNALRALEENKAKGVEQDKVSNYQMGSIMELKGRDKEALEYYFRAAAENYRDSSKKALYLYKKVTGSSEGFEAKLEAKQHELPFEPQKFQPGPEWKGKAVVVELFTGSECPPCVAADVAVDGLLETLTPEYLAVLEYHLPIPRPDPMMNQATALRAGRYGVRSVPSIFIDGQPLAGGGGPIFMAKAKYEQYLEQIWQRINVDPGLKLKLETSLQGDDILVSYTLNKLPDNADCHAALVQKEEKFQGGNGIIFHKMIVREFKTVADPPGLSGRLTINLPGAEQSALQRVGEYEKQMGFTSKEKHAAIDRTRLRIVFFIQDKSTDKVYTAAVADVK